MTRRFDVAALGSKYGLIIIWALVVLGFSLFGPSGFASWSNMQTIFGSQSVVLILALGLCIALNAGEVDLSIAGVMSASVVLLGELNGVDGVPIWPAVIICLLTGALIGAVNALFVVGVGIDPMVVTLGMGTLLQGVSVAINQKTVFTISPGLVSFMRHKTLSLPTSFWVAVVLTLVLWFALRFTVGGVHLRFIGSNRNASRLTGIRVDKLRVFSLVGCSTFASLAGIVMVGTLGSSNPTVASPYLMPAFAAVFLGSTAIQPGRFNAIGTFVAVYFLTTGITGIQLIGTAAWAENVFYGAAVILAVAASTIVGKLRRAGRLEAVHIPTAGPGEADSSGTGDVPEAVQVTA